MDLQRAASEWEAAAEKDWLERFDLTGSKRHTGRAKGFELRTISFEDLTTALPPVASTPEAYIYPSIVD